MTQNMKLHDEIAIVAYTLFQNSGRLHGYDVENWLEAEKMVMEAYAKGVETDAKKPSKTKAKKTK